MKPYIIAFSAAILFFVGVICFLGYQHMQLTQVEAQGVGAVPTQCIGEELADYMNSALAGAGSVSKVKLVSPIFNLTNPAEAEIFSYMVQFGAEFNRLDAFAGNTYNIDGSLAYDLYVNNGWPSAFENANSSAQVIFTEFGDFVGDIGAMQAEYNRTALDGKIIGINFFNAAGTGFGFTYHVIDSANFQSIISGNPAKAGINTATSARSQNMSLIDNHAGGNLSWAVEIYNSPDVGGVVASAQAAQAAGISNYVVRLCTATGGCGFEDPATLSQFIKDIDAQAPDGITIWVVVGPNEPATERWATPDCVIEREYTLQEVACTDVARDPETGAEVEYHSLRPYPASPTCNPAPDGVWLCGNDLIARQTYTLTADDANGGCTDAGSQLLCNFNTSGSANVYLDLTDADFPIAGNTEKVPNAKSSANRLQDPERVNEYVSWYLNGVINRAEEQPVNVENPLELRRLIDFSGPLRKLLPYDIQTAQRLEEVSQIGTIGPEGRHNQIIECGGSSPTPCYDNLEANPEIVRLNQMSDETQQYAPFSNTEDSVGQIQIGTRSQFQLRPGPADTDIEITNVTFTPSGRSATTSTIPVDLTENALVITGQEDRKNLFFPHLLENSELSETLQLTYLPEGVDGQAGSFSDTADLLAENAPLYCEPITREDARDNDGDSLYGDNTRSGTNSFLGILRNGAQEQDRRVEGAISYNASFSCLIDKPVQTCTEEFDPVLNRLVERCSITEPTCEVPVPVAFAVNVRTPQANETVWDRLVGAHMSVFRRIFPQIGEQTPVEEIEDIPGKTVVRYGSENHTASIGSIEGDTNAGDPERARPGAQAQLFFPHVGSLQEYFLHGIQEALRPQGIGTDTLVDDGEGTTTPTFDGDLCDPETYREAFGENAEGVACVVRRESNCSIPNPNLGCKTVGGTLDYSYGPLQINLLAHPAYPDLTPQKLKDAWAAAGVTGDIWTCKQAFTGTGSTGEYESVNGVLRMKIACREGTSENERKILSVCQQYFSDPVNSIAYMKAFYDRDGDFGPWRASVGQCNLNYD